MAVTSTTTASAALKPEPASPASSTPATNTNASTSTSTTGQPKRRARRAATAERRATHNAVERMRRESLNGRFLTLASMLPPLATLRRPSKAAIVHTSIATVNASRRHRVLAAQTLRSLTREAETLRREINEWRSRARVPQLATPVRSDAHEAVLRAETEDFDLILEEEGLDLEEEDEMPEDDTKNTRNGNESPVSPSTQESRARSTSIVTARGPGAAFYGSASPPVYQEQFTAPLPFEVSPSSPASSASGGWEGPATPPSSATPMRAMTHAHQLAPLQTGMPMKNYEPYFDAAPRSAGAAYDLGLGFDGAESLLLGGGAGMGMGMGMGAGMGMEMGMRWAGSTPSHPSFHYQQAAAQNAIRLRELYEQQQQMLMGGGMGMGIGAPMDMGMGMGMGMGGAKMGTQMQMGVAPGQYLHQTPRFA
ncbi:hypothetical protein C8R47DRAFT_720157 [Mycena vitilis]|nr:hypothetical protein C8R47DRAFT_720157 [Mycena vitilis]